MATTGDSANNASGKSDTCRLLAVANPILETTASSEAFPVFDDSSPEGSPTPTSTPPPSPPTFRRHQRRRSRQVNEIDRRILFGANKPKVFTYVDLVNCLRFPSAPGFLPRAPTSQLGFSSTYTPAALVQLIAFEPAPWAQSRSLSQDQRASSDQQAPTSG
jgi:hypothetical protein